MLVKMGENLPQVSGWKFKKSLSCHHPGLVFQVKFLSVFCTPWPCFFRGVFDQLPRWIADRVSGRFLHTSLSWLVVKFQPIRKKYANVRLDPSSPRFRGEHFWKKYLKSPPLVSSFTTYSRNKLLGIFFVGDVYSFLPWVSSSSSSSSSSSGENVLQFII